MQLESVERGVGPWGARRLRRNAVYAAVYISLKCSNRPQYYVRAAGWLAATSPNSINIDAIWHPGGMCCTFSGDGVVPADRRSVSEERHSDGGGGGQIDKGDISDGGKVGARARSIMALSGRYVSID